MEIRTVKKAMIKKVILKKRANPSEMNIPQNGFDGSNLRPSIKKAKKSQ